MERKFLGFSDVADAGKKEMSVQTFFVEAQFFLSFCWRCDIKWLVFYKHGDGDMQILFQQKLGKFFSLDGCKPFAGLP